MPYGKTRKEVQEKLAAAVHERQQGTIRLRIRRLSSFLPIG
jgi:hypothetical protein